MSSFVAAFELRTTYSSAPGRVSRDVPPEELDLWSGPGAQLVSVPDPVDRALGRSSALARGRMIVAADARLDRKSELSDRLAARGIAPAIDATDTELIALACSEWGPDALDHLHGDFAFVAWEPRTRRALCARDRFGGRPLFHARTGDSLVVSNDLRALRGNLPCSSTIDELFVADFLLFGGSLSPAATAFEAVRRVPPAHAILTSNGHVHLRSYWRLQPQPICLGEPDALERVSDTLKQSIRERLPVDRAAIFLSGGLDSSVIAAAARSARPDIRLTGHSTHYERLIPDVELSFAQAVGRALEIPVRPVALDNHTLFGFWHEGGESPEPTRGTANSIAAALLAGASRDASIGMTGEGGDPLLSPDGLARAAYRDGVRPTVLGVAQAWRLLGRRPPLGLGAVGLRLRDRFLSPSLPTGLAPGLVARLGLAERWRELFASSRMVVAGRRGRSQAALASPMWAALSERYHPCVTGVPFEVRSPFFDLRVIEATLALPSFPWCAHKLILRELGRYHGLPAIITQRTKTFLQGAPDQARAIADPCWLTMPASALADGFVDRATVCRPDLAWRQISFTIRVIDLAHWSRKVVP